MNLADKSKRILPWFAIIFFLIAAIGMFLNLLRTDYLEYIKIDHNYINTLRISIGSFHLPVPQLLPVITNLLSVVLFFFLAFIAAVLLGITKKHCFFPAVLGLSILLLQLVMIIQDCLFWSELSVFKHHAMYMGFSNTFMVTSNICRSIFCLPMSILALYMIIASFLKVTGKKMIVITVVVILLTMVLTLLLSVPVDFLQSLTNIERITIFHGTGIRIGSLLSPNVLSWEFLKEVLFTWGALLFQFAGYLLYLPVALYRSKAPKKED